MKVTERHLDEDQSSVSPTSYYLKGAAVILGTGAAYAVAKTTGALSWLWSGIEAYTSGATVSEDKAVQSMSAAVQDFAETDPLLISPLKSEELDSLDLVEVDSTTAIQQSKEEIIEFSTDEGEKIPAVSAHHHNRQLLWLPLTGEIQVNTYTANDQLNPSVAVFPSGDFVVSWESHGQDGSGYGVYAKRFNSMGGAQGSEFQVNTYTTDDQRYPSVAAFPSGEFVVSWGSGPQYTSYDSANIYVQRYSSMSLKQGGEIPVTTYLHNNYPSVAAFPSGDFVVVWGVPAYYGAVTGGIYAQRFISPNNGQGEFQVASWMMNGAWETSHPSVAVLLSGSFVVVWDWGSYGLCTPGSGPDGNSIGIFAQRYASNGVAQGGQFQVNTYTICDQSYPSVAALPSGDFVVAWASDGQGTWRTWNVYAQRFNAMGQAQGVEFRVNTDMVTYRDQTYPSVAALASGDFVIVWKIHDSQAGVYGIYAQRYSATGVARGAEFQVNTYTGVQDTPNIAPSIAAFQSSGSDFDFVVAWGSSGQDGSGYGVYARLIRGNQMPTLTQNRLTLVDNETVSLTSNQLDATDANLDFDVSNLNGCNSHIDKIRLHFAQ